jgi:long-chain acyl-CoA synthetase
MPTGKHPRAAKLPRWQPEVGDVADGEVRDISGDGQSAGSVLAQRAEIERLVGGRTFCDVLAATAEEHGDLPAYSDTETGAAPWQTISWWQTRELALQVAAGLIGVGLQPGERVALMLPNRTEHVLSDLGAMHAGGVPVTFYATLAPEQIAYMAANCDAVIGVVDGAGELARWQPVLDQLPSLRRVIVRDAAACPDGEKFLTWPALLELGARRQAEFPDEVPERIAAIRSSDPVTLLYTSGTTGHPKGVIITHESALYEVLAAEANGTSVPNVRWVSYLPLAHIAERMFTVYLAVYNIGHVHFCHDAATQLVGAVGSVRPTAFFGVPRVWEKFQAGITALLAADPDEAKRAAVAAAMGTGLRYIRSCQYGQQTTDELAAEFAAAEGSVLRPIRELLGMGEVQIAISAAAPLPPDVGDFFAGLGLRILDVYGMTETTGAFTNNTPDAFKLGTVGRPAPGIEVRIAEDGEILTRGPLNSPGYLNLPEQSAELIDADGWLHTGDIGAIDADGFVSVVDRKKELIITAGGENVSPAAVENLLVAHPLIGQALAYGDQRPYLVAILTLDGAVAPGWAKAHGIEAGSLAELAADPDVLAEVGRAVAEANARLARVQQIKYWRLLSVEWTAESEELTPTLKLKRRVVHAKYADIIDALYAG